MKRSEVPKLVPTVDGRRVVDEPDVGRSTNGPPCPHCGGRGPAGCPICNGSGELPDDARRNEDSEV